MGDSSKSQTSNFYSILGIPKSASLSEICKAYKSLVMKWHPDRNPSNKTEAQAKFCSINEAMSRESPRTSPELSDSSRRGNIPVPPPVDLYGGRGNTSTPTTSTSSAEEVPLSKIASRRCTTPIFFSQSKARVKPPPIQRKIECTLEELCLGCVKKIKITRDAISTSGLIVEEEEILIIQVQPGWKKGTKITFEGKGDERPGTLPADIIFSIDEKNHPLFKRNGNDLELGVEVPLVQALTGCTTPIPLLGGGQMTLTINDIIYPGFEKVIPGQGMPISRHGNRGDLRLRFLVEFPPCSIISARLHQLR